MKRVFLTVLVILLGLLLIGCDSVTDEKESGYDSVGRLEDSLALITLRDLNPLSKIADKGDEYNYWDDGKSIDSWNGIGINETGRVDSLFLWYKEISTIPQDIERISFLRYLSIGGNQLDSIPSYIGNLSNLVSLEISHNPLGSIPEELSRLSNLEAFAARETQLTSFPLLIENITSLVYLNLSDNMITSIPSEIGNHRSLSHILLNNNQIDTLPVVIGDLSLIRLWLYSNQLTSIPDELKNLTDLTHFDCRGNYLPQATVDSLRDFPNYNINWRFSPQREVITD